MSKRFFSGCYCPPTGAMNGAPDRLTDKVFQALKDAGITRIFGYGADMRETTHLESMRQCEKFGMGFCVGLQCRKDYVRYLPGENGEKPWADLTQAEKAALDEQMVAEVKPYLQYPAFRGVFFVDEAGYLSLEGIAHARNVFSKHYPDLEFHVNMFSFCLNDAIFWRGYDGFKGMEELQTQGLPFALEGKLEIKFENRFHFYDKLLEGLLSKAQFEYISQDLYPFTNVWPTVPTSVHRGLFDLNAILKEKSLKYGCKFWNFQQVGQWFEGRTMTAGEMALQMNAVVAYGGAGFGHFPGVFPLDWMEEYEAYSHGQTGYVDISGNPTVYVQQAKAVTDFLDTIAKDILDARFVGITTYGIYNNGFTWDEIKELPDAECIYVGELSDILRYEDERIQAQCSNQISLSTFLKDGKRRYYTVNLSTVYDNEVKLTLPKGSYDIYAADGIKACDGRVEAVLKPGCAMYILEK